MKLFRNSSSQTMQKQKGSKNLLKPIFMQLGEWVEFHALHGVTIEEALAL